MIEAFASLYKPGFIRALAYTLETSDYKIRAYLRWFWRTNNFSKVVPKNATFSKRVQFIQITLYIWAVLEITAAIALAILGRDNTTDGIFQFAVALLVATPLVTAHLVVLFLLIKRLINGLLKPRTAGKSILCGLLESQVRRLRHRRDFKVIVVAGSVGKTSTKLAIATVLSEKLKVIHQEGNYNDRLTVPLVFFGHCTPALLNIFSWLKILLSNERALRRTYPYEVAVLELGTDGPGQMAKFAYLKPDLAVITAVVPEHMEFFDSLNQVAGEELSVAAYSRDLLVNIDDVPEQYLKNKQYLSFGLKKLAQYRAAKISGNGLNGQRAAFYLKEENSVISDIQMLGRQGLKVALAAAAVAHIMGLDVLSIRRGLKKIVPFAGRMQILKGVKGSVIIDDTYNASPDAVKAALDVLYNLESAQKIAILGNMNELGSYSEDAHKSVGQYCRPSELALVATIGPDANKFLAAAAETKGCQVKRFSSPYEMARYIKPLLKRGSIILAKGSQFGVFTEETVKLLLAEPENTTKLVRQSKSWMKQKAKSFKQ